jgi:hypothetical protein
MCCLLQDLLPKPLVFERLALKATENIHDKSSMQEAKKLLLRVEDLIEVGAFISFPLPHSHTLGNHLKHRVDLTDFSFSAQRLCFAASWLCLNGLGERQSD